MRFLNFQKKKKHHVNTVGDLTIRNLTEEMNSVKGEIGKLFLKHGFKPVTVKLANGQGEIDCYNLGELYCHIDFMKNYNTEGDLTDWVLIEYADSLFDAEVSGFEDGDSVPLDIPYEQIIAEIEQELIKNINN